MVARGDLGVELPIEQVPGKQKQITRAARAAGKPVVVATQMLESMISSPMPTRAEVSDVATAVFDGADAVMLSAESASGKYPVEAVDMMDRVARSIEGDAQYRMVIDAQRSEGEATTADAITAASRQVAQTLKAAAIVCWTSSGSTALRAARERPGSPIIVLTPVASTGRQACDRVGLALRRHRRRARFGRHGRAGVPIRVSRGFCHDQSTHRRDGGRAAAHAGRDEFAAGCVCRAKDGRVRRLASRSAVCVRLRTLAGRRGGRRLPASG